MITVNKANPTPGEITSSLTGSTGDGAGLHFDGAAANVAFTPVDLGTKCSFEFVVKASSWTDSSFKYLVDFGSGGRFTIGTADTAGAQLAIYNGSNFYSFGVSTLDDLKVHHLVVTVDATSAVLYDNGNLVGTATITSPTIDSCSLARLASKHDSNLGRFYGTYYRARFYNKTLSADDVRTAYERADVDYADQYGSQTNLVNPAANGDFSGAGNWVGQGNHSASIVSGELQVVASGASNGSSNAATLAATYGGTGTNGKVYKWEFTARASSGTPTLRARTPFDHSDVTTGSYKDFVLSTSNQTFSITGKRIALENAFFGLLEAGTFFIDNIKATQIGCVSDYQTQWANPTQSLTVQDASGNADGTCSSSGVTQVQPVVQLNSTSARIGTSAATPADGELLVGGYLGVGCDPSRELEVSGSGNVYTRITARTANDSTALELANTGGTWTIVNDDTASEALKFKNSAGTKLTIDSTGLCTFSGGINLGDTTLSNYKEGTFTPTLAKGSTSVTSPNTATGRYVRVGKQLFVTFYFYKTGAPTTSGTNNWTIGGLPFACVTGAPYGSISAGYVYIQSTSYQFTSPYRWQTGSVGTELLLYGTQGQTNNTGGTVEFSGFGVLEIA